MQLQEDKTVLQQSNQYRLYYPVKENANQHGKMVCRWVRDKNSKLYCKWECLRDFN